MQELSYRHLIANICFCFFVYKDYNTGATSIGIPIAKAFLSNISFVVFAFLIANVGVAATSVLS